VSLEPVRDALLADAETDAERLVGRADAQADAQVREAEEQKAALVRRAQTEGEAAARLEAAAELAEARRGARRVVLEAQRAAYDDVRREVHAAAQRLRSQAGYPDLLDRLAARASAELGAGAEIERDPPGGGVIGRLGNKRVDHSLPALVERCLARHAPELERLWT
jgi:vacuolar-type H+-ATPase subunit E/Vma4